MSTKTLERDAKKKISNVKDENKKEELTTIKQNYVLTEAQMYYYQNTNVGKGTGEIVEIDWD